MNDKIEETATSIALTDVVDTFRTAFGIVKARTGGELKITLTKVDLHLKVESKIEAKAGGKFLYYVPIEVGGSHESTKTHELILSLIPSPAAADLGKAEAEELADAIVDLAAAAVDIKRRVAKDFQLDTFSISVDVGVSRGGKLQVIVGGGKSTGTSHKIDLSFRTR